MFRFFFLIPFLLISPSNTLAQVNRSNFYTVVIDPGHGGEDQGATAQLRGKKITEKDIALRISLRLRNILETPKFNQILGKPIKVHLTRIADSPVSLVDRSSTARNLKADLFVSIHANLDPKSKARGFETYFLNNTDDESTQKLEQIENRLAPTGHGSASSLLLRSVLADGIVKRSEEAATHINESMRPALKSLSIHNRGVKQAMFYVLLDSQVPSVLIEAGFLSDKRDLAILTDAKSRQLLAEGIAKGILRYLAVQ